jgi:hypothetical protein
MLRTAFIVAALSVAVAPGWANSDSHDHDHDHSAVERTPSPEGASVYFINPADGDTVSNPVTFQFGARGIGIAPAGANWPDTGHHHMLINIDPADLDLNADMPFDDNHLHFGGGQTETTLELPPGTHTFVLVMADDFHIPHDPPLISEVITLTVE